MTAELVQQQPQHFTSEQIDLIKRQIAPGASNDELALFLAQCEHAGLNPLYRQIYWIKRGNKGSTQVAIDGFRLIAARTGEYEGQVGPYWCAADGVWHDVWLSPAAPIAAKVGVLRKGFREPVWGVARTEAYRPAAGGGSLWDRMADVMIAKVAEALGLRKSFPAEMSGLYTTDEMDQADNRPAPVHTSRPALPRAATKAAPVVTVEATTPAGPPIDAAAPWEHPAEPELLATAGFPAYDHDSIDASDAMSEAKVKRTFAIAHKLWPDLDGDEFKTRLLKAATTILKAEVRDLGRLQYRDGNEVMHGLEAEAKKRGVWQ